MDKEKTFNVESEREYGFNLARSTEFKTYFEYRAKTKPTVSDVSEAVNNILFIINFRNGGCGNILVSKERLAEILIAETESRLKISNENWEPKTKPMTEEEVISPEQKAIVNDCPLVSPFEDAVNKKLYSQKEYLQFGESCFNAARKNNTEWYFKYKNFSDFMNSQSEGK